MTGRPPGASEGFSLQEAAERLGVHYMTVYRYVRLGLLPATKEGSTWRVADVDIERLRHERASTAAGASEGEGRARSSPAPWATRLDRRLRAGDEAGAWGVVEAALSAGAEPRAIYLDVLSPALRAIGEAWAVGEIDVAVEHRASAIALRLVGRLGPRFARRGRSRGSIVLGAPAGDRHGLPPALLADLVRGAGFEAVDLGADVPAASFVLAVGRAKRLVAVAVSVTTPANNASVAELVAGLKATTAAPVLVGGGGIADEATALALGADGWAADGRGALDLLDRVEAGALGSVADAP